ncbi:hypothetical protein [Capnocytophaga ochracea]|uniref:Uncharacterized protein n=1 Tax=Capnocytophaga ochracea TaxID=1018 RepID=A0A2X2SN26_CAPOC|nr:hypothetical protein [Capnocytophaga ochracea]SQA93274.1 Uncharacterised protein [Capnocytophaga ochracea]
MEVIIHIAKRFALLVLGWIVSFIIASRFINKDYFCATGDVFVYFFWFALFYILFGTFLLIEVYFLHKKKKRGCVIANTVMALPMLLFMYALIDIYLN